MLLPAASLHTPAINFPGCLQHKGGSEYCPTNKSIGSDISSLQIGLSKLVSQCVTMNYRNAKLMFELIYPIT